MTSRLRELIRAVRAAKTAAEERDVVAREGASIRTAIKDDENPYRARNVAKIMYMHMLGYDVSWGKMAAITLITSEKFPEKRVGYLAIALVFEDDDNMLTLVQNQIAKDMLDTNALVQALAIHTLANIGNESMLRDLLPAVLKMCDHSNAYIRKKAALAAVRTVRRVSDLVDLVGEKIVNMLQDKNHGMLVASVQLAHECCLVNADIAELIDRKCVPFLCRLLRNLLASNSAVEHDVGGVADPFLQVKIIRLLRLLMEMGSSQQEAIIEILALVATNTEQGKNAGNAVLYECCHTIMELDASPQPMRVLAVNVLGRFLSNKDNNLRYTALHSLSRVVQRDSAAIQKHRGTVLECLRDPDVSIQKRAADLVCALARSTNVDILVPEMILFLEASKDDMKEDIAPKLCTLIEQYAPSPKWHVDWAVDLLRVAGRFVGYDHIAMLVSVVSKAPEIQPYVVRKMFRYLEAYQTQVSQPKVIELACWTIGEFGELLLVPYASPTNVAAARLPDGGAEEPESNSPVTESRILDAVDYVLRTPLSMRSQLYALTAATKLVVRLPSSESRTRIAEMIDRFRRAVPLELQSRAHEFYLIVTNRDPSVRNRLLDKLPAYEKANLAALSSPSSSNAGHNFAEGNLLPVSPSGPAGSTAAAAPKPNNLASDIDALLDFGGSSAAALPLTGGSLFGGMGLTTTASAPAAKPSQQLGVDDLLSGFGSMTTSSAAGSIPAPYRSAYHDTTADLLTPMPIAHVAPAPAPVVQPAAPTGNATVPSSGGPSHAAASAASGDIPAKDLFNQFGITIRSDFKKHPTNPQITAMRFAFRNDNPHEIENFVFQAAVPKYIKLELKTASSKNLPANGSSWVHQEVRVTNSMHGTKSVVMRIKLEWDENGTHRVEQGEINSFPAGV
eukprot:ANDGO_04795.mRNA.1 AP-1 complex subunit gamma-2